MTKLSADEKRAIEAFLRIAAARQVPTFAVGANARMLVLDQRFGLPVQRITVDWDFATRIESWDDYEAFARDLQTNGVFRRSPNSLHQFVHQDTDIPVDIVPFGGVANEEGLIDWPETEKQMSAIGFDAAYEHATTFTLEDETIYVATLPWHVALKLIAYGDRRAEKDLRDLDFMLQHATEVLIDRVFDELGDHLADERLTYEEVGAYLIGSDLAAQGTAVVKTALLDVLGSLLDDRNHLDLRRQLLSPAQRGTHEAILDMIVERLEALRRGIVEGR